ncbi:ABC transporter permease/M1 family aminopeptidase [Urechidicola vernalis]|uniref:M1 family aminopeptidase n=1 Tax=Urechidicola vernalis TaxID=3075600 RepID=A0ABU2Y6W4_9FLAO|nr:M1 family aminopeptidase [Urechidicola sp. P050]MDT0553940.1 M1 family aminopeptidase [Urechidicola sp. P050]
MLKLMWYEIFKFELKYRLKRLDTYIFFIFLFLFSIVGVDFIFQGVDIGGIKMNAPLVIAKTMGAVTGIFMILASMIMGVPILRDFEYNIASLMYTNPIKKRDYLLGRFLGSFAVLLFVFSGVLFGMIIGEFMPWHSPEEYHPFHFYNYLKPFITIILPALFFGAALFFVSGALSKKLVVVYTQGIFLFVVFMLTKAITNAVAQAILDPFSLTTLTLITDTWTVAERNIQAIPFSGVLLFNKLFWVVLGSAILVFGYYKFNFSVINDKGRFKKKSTSLDLESNEKINTEIPEFKTSHGLRSKWNELKHFSWFYFVSICKQPSFWAIVICGMIIILINSVNLGTVYGVDSFPASYFIVEELQESSIYFFLIILVFYSGELIWKERSLKLNLIYDATSMSNFLHLSGKFIGLIGIYIVLMFSLILSGVLFQTMNGYYNYEFQVYFNGFFLEILPFLILYTFIAFLIQVLINRKFIAIFVVLIFFILSTLLGALGYNHPLYFFGGSSLSIYSNMNGYGHFLAPYLIIKSYWLTFGVLLLVVSSIISVRGTDSNLIQRLKASKNRMSRPIITLGISILVVFLLLGSFIFYNTNILNTYWSNVEKTQFRVAYEKTLKKYEYLPQPKIVDVNLNVELYPKSRDYKVEGFYILKNTSDTIISEVHIQKMIESDIKLKDVLFEGGATKYNKYKAYDYSIYKLNNALFPGDSVKMNFNQTYITKGFETNNGNTSIINNGTFFNHENFPTIGYSKKYELQDAEERLHHNLPERDNKAKINNAKELINARSGSDSDGINFEIIVGTSANQTAIAPGTLLKKWSKNNRNYFHYKMKNKMINFYSIVSATYEIKKDVWDQAKDSLANSVALEVYYSKGHDYNVDRMMTAMKASFEYFSTNFSPYQYEHMRIMEFPRYAEFAQSYPGTVPFSEAIGFVLDIDDEIDVDMAFYVTAHELAHQWFGMQVEAANVQGQHFILETLSQYAAIMVLKQHYSEDKVQQFLHLQIDNYNEGKRKENKQEPTLALVTNQEYIYYAKGAMAMYKLQQQIGEEQVNIALKRFIEDWNTKDGALKTKTNRYATSNDLLGYFKEICTEEQRHIIDELFESTNPIDITSN